jgi:hypothetical protein
LRPENESTLSNYEIWLFGRLHSCLRGTKSRRGAQAGARGATQVLDRGVQAVARGAACCLLYVLGRGAKTDACCRSFAVLPRQVLAAGLRLRHSRLACGNMLEMSHDAVEAGEEQLASYAPEQSKYCFICTCTLGPCGDWPFTSWGRWQCLHGGVDAGLNSCYAACGCGTEFWYGALPGEDVWRHA